jgi:mono/diheme cytochrome c family protein
VNPPVCHTSRGRARAGLTGGPEPALPHVIEDLVNHRSGHKAGVAAVYNRAEYRAERARAMQLWADHLLQGEPAQVIPLRA